MITLKIKEGDAIAVLQALREYHHDPSAKSEQRKSVKSVADDLYQLTFPRGAYLKE